MAILKVAQLGNPILRDQSSEVSLEQIEGRVFQQLVDDMVSTMREYDGVGIAAPQVHVGLRVLAMEVQANLRYPSEAQYPLTVLVNPVLIKRGTEMVDGWEGCLSIPGLRGLVPRHYTVNVKALDRTGKDIELHLEGFPARIVQHEIDHLDGKVFLDRMQDLTSLTFQREFEKFIMSSRS